jgi:UDP-N-acetylglucosamine 2-epimerase (non-hydrolysing)
MAPVLREMRSRSADFAPVFVSTGQHPELVQGACDVFDLQPDVSLPLPPVSASLAARSASLLANCDAWFSQTPLDAVLVQGDTSSAMCAALAAFYRGLPVGHVEAGLRTRDPWSPFPEEAHRQSIAAYARWSFCPTASARQHLLAEGVAEERIVVTGNTVIDSIRWLSGRPTPPAISSSVARLFATHRTMLITVHRREHIPHGVTALCRAIAELLRRVPDLAGVFPVHHNPQVQEIVARQAGATERLVCCEPQPYDVMAAMLSRCVLVVTDSGGLQEEAPSYGKRVVLCRANTERPEGVAAGTTLVAGPDADAIVDACLTALNLPPVPPGANPFGDGYAAGRICDALLRARSSW